MNTPTHSPGRARGYTIIELLTTMSVVAIVTAIAVPNLQSFMQNNRAAADANALVGALNVARNEAVTRGIPVSVCASDDGASCTGDDDWSSGWIVFTDGNGALGAVNGGGNPDTVLQTFPALTGGSTVTADTDFVSYRPNGFLAGDAAAFLLDVEHCTGDHKRLINVNPQGRAGVNYVSCDEVVDVDDDDLPDAPDVI